MESNNQPKNNSLRGNTEPPLIRYLLTKAGRTATPISGTFELTPRCNFDCKMCYVHLSKSEQTSRGNELSADTWLSLGEEGVRNGLLMLLLTGGEPLIRPDFIQIYEGLKNLGIMISINTNGSLLDDDMLAYFKHNPPYKFNISLYGASEETYERLCGNASGFRKTVHALKTLKEYGINTKVNLSITQYNTNDVDGVYAITDDIGLNVQASSYMFPPMRRSHDLIGCGDRFTSDESAEMKLRLNLLRMDDERFMDYARKISEGIRVIDENDECLDIPTVEEQTPTEHLRCRAGVCTFWVTWDGRMLPCGMMEKPSCSLLDLGFKEAWKYTHEATKSIFMSPKCTACDKRFACDVCAASTYTETGEFDGEAPKYICALTDKYIKLVLDEYNRRLALQSSENK
ncbi:MAG: radical SAM protein [Clostridia bacterium]|nr:radical SAM protein [Clostridia bacterium]